MKAIHLGFSFLKKRFKLVIAAPARAAVANIGGATIHRTLSIDERIKNKKKRTIKGLWQNCTILIVDVISMVSLKLLSMVDSQLSQTKRKKNNDIIVLGSLALIIIMGGFYQFLSVVGKSL